MSRYCAEPSQGHDQQDETRVQSIPDFPVKAGFTGESDKFRSPSALARANAGFEAMAPCYGWRSPHTRGALGEAPELLGEGRIIPAYAGSTGLCNLGPEAEPDHPRIRGEHGHGLLELADAAGSSPHTRGALQPFDLAEDVVGIIPAYAGSTVAARAPAGISRDHPRIRGEHECQVARVLAVVGSSPHTRGALHQIRHCAIERGIIPAYAGSTRWKKCDSDFGRDHPRIRGEHRALNPGGVFSAGSSPHTRGAQGV